MLPVLARDLGRAQRAGKDRHGHLDRCFPAVLYFGVDIAKNGRVGIGLDALGHALGADGIALDVQVGVVDRVVLVCAGRHVPKEPGIQHLAASERREPDLTTPLAPVVARRADTGHRDDAS